MRTSLSLLWSLLLPWQRRLYLVLLFALLLVALFEVGAIYAVALFMRPVLQANSLTQPVQFAGYRLTLQELGACTALAFTASNFMLGASTFAIVRFSWHVEVDLSCRVLEAVLQNPLALADRHSGSLLQDIWCTNLCAKIRLSLVSWARLCSTAFLSAALLTVDWKATLCAVGLLALVYHSIHAILKGPIREMSERWQLSQGRRQVLTQELLALRKTLFVHQGTPALVQNYRCVTADSARQSGFGSLSAELPRYALESSALAGIVSLCLYLVSINDHRILELISLFGLAGYRILPGLHYIFSAVTDISFVAPQARNTLSLLSNPAGVPVQSDSSLPFVHSFGLKNVDFEYHDRSQSVLEGLSLVVEKGSWVGLAGASGTGKSTIIDLCLGALQPTSGAFQVDGRSLSAQDFVDWRSQLGYLPQHIEVLDDTIEANVVMGHDVNEQLLEVAIALSCLDEVLQGLPAGRATPVGESGSSLSVGQKQRLGLARALYRDPLVLFLDEMSSSLDGQTEERILSHLRRLRGRKTLLMSAHRAKVLAACDFIYFLRDGKIAAQGTYQELWDSSPEFRLCLSHDPQSGAVNGPAGPVGDELEGGFEPTPENFIRA